MSQPAKSSAGARSASFSVIGGDVTVTGNISATVDLHLDGRVEGDISCATLVQGTDSVIRGAVTAETARLAGRVEGSIHVRELVIQASARIEGDVTYETLTMEQGSQVEGRFSLKRPEAPVLQAVVND
ncbi:bactofilin family protein [Sandaracinobacteroides hominis]|uniref:bactofilin family protein n=1 Tax=Sandaracinobacteroides hominis TaxID=2780086 RepID=UPI001F3A4CB5|nr:polymer-forming cytoskeletal protein [Sandaracinobacteroides hominis]